MLWAYLSAWLLTGERINDKAVSPLSVLNLRLKLSVKLQFEPEAGEY